ncbi:hypothetical protein Hanom_Chr15g01357951 [Helianthus anomalus]
MPITSPTTTIAIVFTPLADVFSFLASAPAVRLYVSNTFFSASHSLVFFFDSFSYTPSSRAFPSLFSPFSSTPVFGGCVLIYIWFIHRLWKCSGLSFLEFCRWSDRLRFLRFCRWSDQFWLPNKENVSFEFCTDFVEVTVSRHWKLHTKSTPCVLVELSLAANDQVSCSKLNPQLFLSKTYR